LQATLLGIRPAAEGRRNDAWKRWSMVKRGKAWGWSICSSSSSGHRYTSFILQQASQIHSSVHICSGEHLRPELKRQHWGDFPGNQTNEIIICLTSPIHKVACTQRILHKRTFWLLLQQHHGTHHQAHVGRGHSSALHFHIHINNAPFLSMEATSFRRLSWLPLSPSCSCFIAGSWFSCARISSMSLLSSFNCTKVNNVHADKSCAYEGKAQNERQRRRWGRPQNKRLKRLSATMPVCSGRPSGRFQYMLLCFLGQFPPRRIICAWLQQCVLIELLLVKRVLCRGIAVRAFHFYKQQIVLGSLSSCGHKGE